MYSLHTNPTSRKLVEEEMQGTCDEELDGKDFAADDCQPA
jgi:hypothetical protein